MAMFDDLKQGLAEVDAFLSGEHTGAKVTIPAQVDVKIIRKRLNMTQAKFASAFGFSLDTIKHWEAGRRNPEGPARALLTVISKNPNAVLSALHPEKPKHRKAS
jgi:putative transcriptional regulator